jgi:hypothetical protein
MIFAHAHAHDMQLAKSLVWALKPSRRDIHREWIQVGASLYSVDSSEHALRIWEEWSYASAQEYPDGQCVDAWAKFGAAGALVQAYGMPSLYTWACRDNPIKVKKIMNGRYYKEILWCNGSHNDIAKVSALLLCCRHLYDASVGQWYVFDTDHWKQDRDAIMLRHELSTTVRDHFRMTMDKYMCWNPSSQEVDEWRVRKLRCVPNKLQDVLFKDKIEREAREYMLHQPQCNLS